MKLLLVQSSHLLHDGTVFNSRRLMYPGLALPIVAALTPRHYDIRLVNDYAEKVPIGEPFDLVGISAMTPQAPRAYQIADAFRKRGVKTVLGGFHGSFFPDEALEHFDAVVVGEAEASWPKVIRDFERAELGRIYSAQEPVDMAEVPTPRYDLVNRSNYALRALPVQTTRGCPHRCEFCSVHLFFGGRYRRRPVEKVVADIKAARCGNIFFVDDNIAASRSYALELFEALKPLKLFWGSQCTIGVGKDPELLSKASEAGCFALFLGVESLNPRTLARYNKSFNDTALYAEGIQEIKRHGIRPMVSLIMGLDGDGPEMFDTTFQFLMDNRVPIAYTYILTPAPGTPLFNRLEEEGRLFNKDWSSYGGDEVVFTPECLSAEELTRGFWEFQKRFYSLGSVARRLWPPEFSKRWIATMKYNRLHWMTLRKGIHPMRG